MLKITTKNDQRIFTQLDVGCIVHKKTLYSCCHTADRWGMKVSTRPFSKIQYYMISNLVTFACIVTLYAKYLLLLITFAKFESQNLHFLFED